MIWEIVCIVYFLFGVFKFIAPVYILRTKEIENRNIVAIKKRIPGKNKTNDR